MALLHMEASHDVSPSKGGACDDSAAAYGATSPTGKASATAPGTSAPATTKSTATGDDAKSMVTHRMAKAPAGKLPAAPDASGDEEESKALLRSKDLALTLLERYQNAVSTKMYDVEELVDYYFHRRLAAVTAVVISYLPFVVTPNQITIFGLGLGWASALCLYDSEFHYPLAWHPHESLLAASLFMFLWIVSDCADGQVARLCKRGTRTGRILDGVVDGLVIAPNMWILGLLSANRYGAPYFYVAIISGFSLWLHAIIYDKIKNTYMENALPFSECDGETVESVKQEFAEAKAKDPYSLESILLGIYVVYLMVQTAVTSDAASKAESTRHGMLAKCDDHYHASYINKYGYVVRLASFLGISAHVTGLYVAYFAAIYVWDALFYVQMYFLVALNGLLLVVLSFYFKSGMATQQPLNSAM